MKTVLSYPESMKWENFQLNQKVSFIDDQINLDLSECSKKKLFKKTLQDIFYQSTSRLVSQNILAVRNVVRFSVKTPIRCVYRPIKQKCIWMQYERVKINGMLVLCSVAQLISIPYKISSNIVVLGTLPFSTRLAHLVLNKNIVFDKKLDILMSKCEALKEEALKQSSSKSAFKEYKNWLGIKF